MRIQILATAAAVLCLSAYSAQAEDFTYGKVKMYDPDSRVVTLDSGASFILNPDFHPNIRPGEAVVVDWQDNVNGDSYADYVGPTATMAQDL
ncbi:hypothetical protein [Phyllobacterium salinisoli]|nr:hypothetical protein [Phyllobacterium salinisoli]